MLRKVIVTAAGLLVGNCIDFDNVVHNGSATAAPEPGSLALIGLGGLAMLRRRTRRA